MTTPHGSHMQHRRAPLRLALLMSVLVVLLLAGCMGGDNANDVDHVTSPEAATAAIPPSVVADATTEPGAPTSTIAPETPTPEAPTPSPTPVDTRALVLSEALLTLEDLPTGYYQRRTADESSTQTAPTQGVCNVPLTGPAAEVSVARVWERTLNGPFVRQELLWLPDDPDAVSTWLRERRMAARACDSWVDADGSTSEVTILRRPVFASGAPADAIAVRVVTTAADAHPIDLVSIVLVADHIATITTLIDLGADVDQDLALSLAELAYERATALAGTLAADNP